VQDHAQPYCRRTSDRDGDGRVSLADWHRVVWVCIHAKRNPPVVVVVGLHRGCRQRRNTARNAKGGRRVPVGRGQARLGLRDGHPSASGIGNDIQSTQSDPSPAGDRAHTIRRGGDGSREAGAWANDGTVSAACPRVGAGGTVPRIVSAARVAGFYFRARVCGRPIEWRPPAHTCGETEHRQPNSSLQALPSRATDVAVHGEPRLATTAGTCRTSHRANPIR
jgi:hypothetical protein